MNQTTYLVNGEIRSWSGPAQKILSPIHLRTGDSVEPCLLGSVPSLSAEAAGDALQAAVAAYDSGRGPWPTMAVAERISCVEHFTRLVTEKRHEVIRLIMWEIAKTLADATKEFDRTMDYIRDTLEALKELDRAASRFEIKEGIIAQIRRSPLGVVLCMGPYNYPLNETFATLIPALVMGNTCLLKPPRFGVLLYGPMLEAFQKAFPPGVVNVIYGDGQTIVGPIMQTGQIDVLAFIGSSRVADVLKKAHPHPHRLRAILGMGAKNAAIVLPDANLNLAVKECLTGSLSYNGQRCTALKILFVHKSIADRFVEKFTSELSQMICGMPWQDKVQITPLPNEEHCDYMEELVADATAKGARIASAGLVRNRSFFQPAVLYPALLTMRICQEEQFGPVVPVVPFDSLDLPINWIRESNFGQQVSLFGTDANVMSVLIDPMVNQVCRVNINSQCQRGPDLFPFTGRKGSAEGTLSVSDALYQFSIRTLVATKENAENKALLKQIVHDHKSNFLSTDYIF